MEEGLCLSSVSVQLVFNSDPSVEPPQACMFAVGLSTGGGCEVGIFSFNWAVPFISTMPQPNIEPDTGRGPK